MNLEKFRATKEYLALSVKRRLWLLSFIAGDFDKSLATQMAYQSTGQNTRTFGYHVLKAKKVKAALARYQNKSKREIFMADLKTELAAAKPGSAARATLVALYGSLMFGKNKGRNRK
jgi:hypothetical protein